MNADRPRLTGEPSTQRAPTKRQLSYLRRLAMQRGETFAVPSSSVQASAEIDRLKGRRRLSTAERRIERVERLRDAESSGLDAASVRAFEIEGYGSSARWRGGS